MKLGASWRPANITQFINYLLLRRHIHGDRYLDIQGSRLTNHTHARIISYHTLERTEFGMRVGRPLLAFLVFLVQQERADGKDYAHARAVYCAMRVQSGSCLFELDRTVSI